MMAGTYRRAALALLLALALLTAACKGGAATATATAPPDRPEVTPAPGKAAPPAATRFLGYALKITPARGQAVILQEPFGAQQILVAYETQRLLVTDPVAKFNSRLDMLDSAGEVRYSFNVASDGQLLFQAADGRVFRMPQYIYYLMEEQLWNHGGSLVDSDVKWQPETGTTALELELPRLLKAAMLPAFGYASAYFTTYSIYGVNTETRDVAKVYLLMTYAGYNEQTGLFKPGFLYTTPATLIFAKTNGLWRLTALRQPPVSKVKKDRYTNIRTIFPYDYMEPVMDDLNRMDKEERDAPQIKDITRQATEYLNDVGLPGLTVDS